MTLLFHDQRWNKVTFLQNFDIIYQSTVFEWLQIYFLRLSTLEKKFNRSAVAFQYWVSNIVLLKIIAEVYVLDFLFAVLYLTYTWQETKIYITICTITVWQTHWNSKYGALWVTITPHFKILYILLLFLSFLCSCQQKSPYKCFYGLSWWREWLHSLDQS